MSALDLNFVRGKKIGYNGTLTEGSPLKLAYDALVAAGAVMVARPSTTTPTLPALPSGLRAAQAIDLYYKRLGPYAPIKSLVEEVADNQANAHQALKYGHNSHLNRSVGGRHARRCERDPVPDQPAHPQDARHESINDMIDL